MLQHADNLVLGGGVYGVHIALALARAFPNQRTVLIEAASELWTAASLYNHGRVHRGYHYPRDAETALQARDGADPFVRDHGTLLYPRKPAYYGLHHDSIVSASQYEEFCRQLDLPCKKLEAVPDFFGDSIDAVYETDEYSFAPDQLRRAVLAELAASNAEVFTGTSAQTVIGDGRHVHVGLNNGTSIVAENVFNCTFAALNTIHVASELPLVPMTIDRIALFQVKMPDAWRGVSATVLDGPFASLVANETVGTHILTHAKYSNLLRSRDLISQAVISESEITRRAEVSLHAAAEFFPALKDATYEGVIVQNKALYGHSPAAGSRSMYTARNYGGLPGYHVVLGGKLTGFYIASEFALSAVRAQLASAVKHRADFALEGFGGEL